MKKNFIVTTHPCTTLFGTVAPPPLTECPPPSTEMTPLTPSSMPWSPASQSQPSSWASRRRRMTVGRVRSLMALWRPSWSSSRTTKTMVRTAMWRRRRATPTRVSATIQQEVQPMEVWDVRRDLEADGQRDEWNQVSKGSRKNIKPAVLSANWTNSCMCVRHWL